MVKESIGNRIRSVRGEKEMTASQLARSVGVTPTAVWNWEENGRRPHQATLSSVARVLGVTIEFLLYGKAEEATTNSATVAEIIEEARSKIARTTGIALERVRVHVELKPNDDPASADISKMVDR
jgi:transcriptional regulator with XRE-family HTH domain